jgi:hypothetical protein
VGHKLRIVARSVSILVVAASICVKLSGAGIWMAVPGLLSLLLLLALVWLAVDLAAFSVAASTWRTRVPLGVATAALALISVVFGTIALNSRSVPVNDLGEVPTGLGQRTTVCLVKVPLSGDFVVIERRIYLMPGVYIYRIIDTVDTAWDAKFQYTEGMILLSYYDNEHKWQQKQFRP